MEITKFALFTISSQLKTRNFFMSFPHAGTNCWRWQLEVNRFAFEAWSDFYAARDGFTWRADFRARRFDWRWWADGLNDRFLNVLRQAGWRRFWHTFLNTFRDTFLGLLHQTRLNISFDFLLDTFGDALRRSTCTLDDASGCLLNARLKWDFKQMECQQLQGKLK